VWRQRSLQLPGLNHELVISEKKFAMKQVKRNASREILLLIVKNKSCSKDPVTVRERAQYIWHPPVNIALLRPTPYT
jgi:hypothetical protein